MGHGQPLNRKPYTYLCRSSCGGVRLHLSLQPLPLVHRVSQLAEAVRQLPACAATRKPLSFGFLAKVSQQPLLAGSRAVTLCRCGNKYPDPARIS